MFLAIKRDVDSAKRRQLPERFSQRHVRVDSASDGSEVVVGGVVAGL